MNNFSQKIISWYEVSGRKNLPWQVEDPYKIWISEIMLQQTQVKTVIPYFETFTSKFPNIESLAKTSLDDVLSLWSGLGYYSRAKNIHKTAVILEKDFNCSLPDTLEDLMMLPGIGFSTAGAILSLGFKKPGVILDGNVKRVLLRMSGNKSPMNQYKTEKSLKEFAKILLPSTKHKQYSQGLMDLGATICKPKNPECMKCPIVTDCCAKEKNIQNEIPVKRNEKEKKEKRIEWVLIKTKTKVLLKRNKNSGIWQNLWLLPEKGFLSLDKIKNLDPVEKNFPSFVHHLSHKKLLISLKIYTIKNKDRLSINRKLYNWVNISDSVNMGVPKPVREILNKI
jgi:A/G-specific adenine glycosylase